MDAVRTKWIVSIGLLATLWSTPALAKSPPGMVHLDFKADVQADGVPTNIQPDAALSPLLQGMVNKWVAQWRYRTGTWQGKSVPGEVSQRIMAEVVPLDAGSVAFRVKEVLTIPVFVDARRARTAPRIPPRYPVDAQVQGIEATLIYAMRRDAQGKPLEVELVDAEVPDAWRRQFDAASVQAIKKWRLEPVEVDGQAIDCRLLVPMTFRLAARNTAPKPTPMPDMQPYLPRFADACPLQPVLETQAAGTHH